MTSAIVLDIEGTTSSLSSVRDQLFPYARARIAPWLQSGRVEAAAVAASVRELCRQPAASLDDVARILEDWSDRDIKAAPLKAAQGLIWNLGFSRGELAGHVYADVPPALAWWHAKGMPVYVFSSGSLAAQRAWFRHTGHGDLSGYFAAHFDGTNPGPKTDPASYQAIASRVGVPPGQVLFISDARDELDAARAAGLWTLGMSRPADGSPDVGDHPVITSFGEITPWMSGRRDA